MVNGCSGTAAIWLLLTTKVTFLTGNYYAIRHLGIPGLQSLLAVHFYVCASVGNQLFIHFLLKIHILWRSIVYFFNHICP